MPVVFVHGVNNRAGPGYDHAVAARDALFKSVFLPAAGLSDTDVISPYWGDSGARFAFDLGCVPTGREGTIELGPAGATSMSLLAAAAAAATPEASQPGTVLLTLARRDFVAAVDLLYAATAQDAAGAEPELARFAAGLAPYALDHDQRPPDWLAQVTDDQDFVVTLQREVRRAAPEPEPTGPPTVVLGIADTLWERAKEGADHLAHEVGSFLGKPAWNAVRELVVPTVPRFLGDVFVYLNEERDHSGMSGPIGTCVFEALRKGASGRTPTDPLIVVGHSLGGAIAYDVLSSSRPDVQVDVFCTVGSQVGLLEEIKVLAASDAAVTAATGRTVARPSAVSHWINVFDYNDVLSYKLEPVFSGVADFSYPSGDLLHAHGAYFNQPSFFRRLGIRVQEALRT